VCRVEKLAGYRQSFTAFGTAGIDHGATTGGFHARAKTVGSGTLDFAGLICSFHGILSVLKSL
jgi:hypothetical protein